MFDSRFLFLLILIFFTLGVAAQPMASLDASVFAYVDDPTFNQDYTIKKPYADISHFSIAGLSIGLGDSLERIGEESMMSHESYLNRIMSMAALSNAHIQGPSFYNYMRDYLQELEVNYGNHPFYFDAYYHPEVQYLTGCNMGKAGLPILEKIQFEDGRVMANLICRTEHASIYFTLDGSQPTTSNVRFTEAFEIPDHVTVRAIAIRDDLEWSPVLAFNKTQAVKEEVIEKLHDDKIMGIYPIPESEEVLVKYKTKAAGEIAITLIDMNRNVHHIDFVNTKKATMGRCRIDASRVPPGSYLIKFKFDSGKTTYRQVVKE